MQDHVLNDLEGFGLKLSDWSNEELAAYLNSLKAVDMQNLDALRGIAASLERIECLLTRASSTGFAVS